jgi:hypothetical protein
MDGRVERPAMTGLLEVREQLSPLSFTNSVHLHEQFHSSIFRKLLRLRRALKNAAIVALS